MFVVVVFCCVLCLFVCFLVVRFFLVFFCFVFGGGEKLRLAQRNFPTRDHQNIFNLILI